MSDFRVPPPHGAVARLLNEAVPGHRLEAVTLAPGSFSNATFFVNTATPSGETERFVLRQYNPENEPPAHKAPREHFALTYLAAHGLPVPRPLFLDATGDLLGAPSLLTTFLPGRHWVGTSKPSVWASEVAATLARLHNVPLPSERGPLMDGNPNVAWFAAGETVPSSLAAHPDGEAVWRAARHAWASFQPDEPVFLHIDLWSGNVLWDGERLVGVLDWEEAGWGDSGVDVAYARLEFTLLGLPDTADALLAEYEARRGRRVANLALWELAAAVRAFPDPAGWWHEWQALGATGSTEDEVRGRLRAFIDRALRHLS